MAIAVEQRQYKTYLLSDGDALVEVVPERGGIITRWQIAGQELLYLEEERFTHPELSVRGGIPILFPICGNLPDDTYQHNGQSYQLKQHGFARDLPWQVQSAAADGTEMVLTLQSSAQTHIGYPYEFVVTFTYRLQGKTLTLHQCVTNPSPVADLPFSVGFHPYFTAPDKSQLEFNIPGTEYQDRQTAKMIEYGGRFDFSQSEIDAAFLSPTSLVSQVTDRDRRYRITLNTSPEFSTLVFWTLKGKDFYCLEPWTAPRNALNTGMHLLNVPPGGSLETEISLTAEFL
jgi:galactose mutarotase-like enzyme